MNTKSIQLLLFILASAALLSSCGDSKNEPPHAAAKGAYPLDVCVVSGEKLGSMGEPHVITHDGVEVRFCCEHCVPKFEANPAAFVAKVKEAKAH